MDALRVRGILSDGIGGLLGWPAARFLDAEQKAVLIACRREVLSDDELCERIAQRILNHMRGGPMSYKLIPLPESLDDAPRVVIDYFTGAVTDHWEVAHAAIHVQAFALAQVHDCQPLYDSEAAPKARVMSDEELRSTLEALRPSEGVKVAAAVDWKSLLLTLAQLLLRLLV